MIEILKDKICRQKKQLDIYRSNIERARINALNSERYLDFIIERAKKVLTKDDYDKVFKNVEIPEKYKTVTEISFERLKERICKIEEELELQIRSNKVMSKIINMLTEKLHKKAD